MTVEANRNAEWRKRHREAGGRTVFAWIGPEAAAALERLQAHNGASLRDTLERLLITAAASLPDVPQSVVVFGPQIDRAPELAARLGLGVIEEGDTLPPREPFHPTGHLYVFREYPHGRDVTRVRVLSFDAALEAAGLTAT